jgi:hypothetical protein
MVCRQLFRTLPHLPAQVVVSATGAQQANPLQTSAAGQLSSSQIQAPSA